MQRSCSYNDNNGGTQPCDLALHGASLHIYVDGASPRLIVWRLKSVSCLETDGLVRISKNGESVICEGELAGNIMAAWNSGGDDLPASGISRRWKLALLSLFVFFVGALLLIYFIFLPWAGDKAIALIPVETEIKLGENLAGRLAEQQRTSPLADSLLNAFVSRIDFDTEYPIKTSVLFSEEINAFALPGGHIFVYSGILGKMKDYRELAALLGHEVAHVRQRHSLRSISRSAASGFFLAAIFGDVSGVSSGIVAQADKFTRLHYSRELETEADLEGLKTLYRNGLGHRGMTGLLNLLGREGDSQPGMMKYLRSHPDTGERIAAVSAATDPSASETGNEELQRIFEALMAAL